MEAGMETVEDRSSEYIIRHEKGAALPSLVGVKSAPFTRFHWRDAFDDFQADTRLAVCAVKSKLDAIDGNVYTAARNKLFPLAVSGQQRYFSNRAGYKLMEAMDTTGVWMELEKHLQQPPAPSQAKEKAKGNRKRARELCFADICGGPGAFTQALMAMGPRHGFKQLRGYGLTLAGSDVLNWYESLLGSPRFTASYGLDGTGDIFKLANIECFATVARTSPIYLAVADGGFNVEFALANFQETISSRILYGQWLAALKVLHLGGSFVLKLFDTFSPLSRAILYLSTFFFERVHVAKPRHSRVVNSERYLVCVNFTGIPTEEWREHLDRCYEEGFVDNDQVPDIIPREWCVRDDLFMADVKEMNETLARQQMIGLKMIIHAVPDVEKSLKASAAPAAPQSQEQ